MKEKVSVVIPAYNSELYIADCLHSVLSQSRPPEEVIVVDDCSTDDTSAIVRSFASRGVKLIKMPVNSGSGAARNLGIRAASHELIAFQDADDLWLTNHCEVLVPLLENYQHVALAFSRTKIFQDEQWNWPIDLPAEQPVECFLWCAPHTRIPQMNVIARKTMLLTTGGYQEELRQGQDYDLFLRLSYKNPFICSHQITTLYRRHPGSITIRNRQRSYYYLYLSQRLFWDQHHLEMPTELRAGYQEAVVGHWVQKLRLYWELRDWDSFEFHLSQHDLIPGSGSVLKQWQLRKRLVAIQPAWAAILRAKRRILSSDAKNGSLQILEPTVR